LHEHLVRTQKTEERKLEQACQTLCYAQQAQDVLQHLAQAIQQQAHSRIASVVTSCLRTVFGEQAYEFKIEFDRKRGRTEARLRFLRGELEVDPLTASGGGMVDVAAFALRAACLMLHRPHLRRLLVLDEPFRFVSAEFQDNVRQMLEGLAKDLEMQIIMVTHNEAYETGNVIRL
jgi:ABC-type molybdenum transport system ATPase subunit/photorepair protein PhrA